MGDLGQRYNAVAIDTNIFVKYSFAFDNPLFSRLKDMIYDGLIFLLPEIIDWEVGRKVNEVDRGRIRKIVERLEALGADSQFTAKVRNDARALAVSVLSDILANVDRWGSFKQSVNAVVIPPKMEVFENVLNMYYNCAPPFERSKDKKHEFPDAIALASLERFCEARSMRVLCISEDIGWSDYAEIANRIDVVNDIGTALERISLGVEAFREILQTVVSNLNSGSGRLFPVFKLQLHLQLEQMEPDIRYESDMRADYEDVEVSLHSFKICDDELDFPRVIDTSDDALRCRMYISVFVDVSARFNFYVWDSVDKEEVFLGREDRTIQREIDIEVVVALSLRQPETSIVSVEVVSIADDVDFGFISYI